VNQFDETLYTTTNLESSDIHLNKYDKFKMVYWARKSLMRSTVVAKWVVKWHRKRQHGYRKTVSLV